MRVMITSQGDQEPKGHHLLVVDDRCMLMDLSQFEGSLHDAGIQRVEWGPLQDGRQGGSITRTDGSRIGLFDRAAIIPYVTAFEAEWKDRDDAHQVSVAEEAERAAATERIRAEAEAEAEKAFVGRMIAKANAEAEAEARVKADAEAAAAALAASNAPPHPTGNPHG